MTMDVIQEMIQAVKNLEDRKDALLLDLVRDNEAAVISMNVDDQLYQGIDADGQEVGPPYRAFTIAMKRIKGQPYDRVTLRDEGDFHASFFIRYGIDQFTLDASDWKRQKLDRKYGSEIFGLTPANIDRLSAMIRERFVEEARKIILA